MVRHTPNRSCERRELLSLLRAETLEGLDHTDGIRRVLDIVVADSLGLDNGIDRNRTLIAAAATATRLLAVGDLEARLEALEAALPRRAARRLPRTADNESRFGEADR